MAEFNVQNLQEVKLELETDSERILVYDENKTVVEMKQEPSECQEEASSYNGNISEGVKQEVDENPDDVYCGDCRKVFGSLDLLREHIDGNFGCEGDLKDASKSIKTTRTCASLTSESANILVPNNLQLSLNNQSNKTAQIKNETKSTIAQNLKRASQKQRFRCEICNLEHVTKIHLKIHKLKHSGETQYGCPVCTKMFSKKKNMIKHRLTHNVI